MESPVAAGLRSRSRSKTPYLRASIDRDGGAEPEHNRRRTPKRSTPMKQLPPVEEAARTRAAAATLLKTSDYSSEESPDRLRTAEQLQNNLNSHYEYTRVTTTTTRRTDAAHAGSVADHILSPIQSPVQHSSPFSASYVYGAGRAYNASGRRSYSPAHSACSTDSSFAEQALADVSKVTERDCTQEHLPYKLYKMAGEYWNKYPKTDYTYSPMSRDRVELAPGQVAVPNMSRRSLSQFRLHGASTTDEELRLLLAQHESAWGGGLRKRYAHDDSSEDEMPRANGGGYTPIRQRWLLTRWLIAVYTAITTTITTTVSSVAEKVRGKERSYAYTHQPQRKQEIGVARRAAATLAAPLLWVYRAFQQVITTTTTETTTWNDVGAGGAAAASARAGSGKRRLWPWLLLLLLPLVGYGCYTNPEVFSTIVRETKASPVEANTSPAILQDPDLARRVAALESWIGGVDSRFEQFDRKLSKIDNIEAQIESHSLKHLQQNLVQIFNINGRDGKMTSDELKGWFDERYVSKDQMSRDVHERLATQTKPGMDEEAMRRLIEEYLTKFESERSVVLRETVRRYVREGGCGECAGGGGGGMDEAAVRRVVAAMLDIYDADKTGVVDYALESAGGQVVSTKCTELYQIKTKQYSVLGIPVWWVYTSPRYALTPGAMPAECWAFQGFPGYLVVRTYAVIEVTGFSVEHMSRLLAADGKIESAPKNFSVYGLREELDPEPHLFGTYTYDASGPAIQRFPVRRPSTVDVGGTRYPLAYDLVELRVESNHGNPTYTCVYRFRVHGNPLSDVRRAAEDSMREAEDV